MDNFDLKKYLAEGRLLKEENEDNKKFDSDIEGNTEKDFGIWFRAGVMGKKQAQQAKDLLTQKGIDFDDKGEFAIDFKGKNIEKREIWQLLRDNNLTKFVIYDHS